MSLFADLFRTRARKIFAIILLAILVFAIFLSIFAHHAEPLLRARVIETLSTRFQSRVELADLRVSVYQGLAVSGKGLMIYGQTDPDIQRPGVQPLIGVDEFRFHAGILSLLLPTHIRTVYIKGLQLNIPPKQDRQQFRNMGPREGRSAL